MRLAQLEVTALSYYIPDLEQGKSGTVVNLAGSKLRPGSSDLTIKCSYGLERMLLRQIEGS